MRFLCVSDIHGNHRALEATLRAAELRGWDQLVACGDHCFPGPDPLAVWKTLVSHQALCIQGVGDRALAELDPDGLSAIGERERARLRRLRETHRELGEIIIARLGKLPPVARLSAESGHALVFVHGSPADPTEPFTHDMTDEQMLALLDEEPADIIVCGGSHVPFQRQIDELRIINVGSVGEAPGANVAHATIIDTHPVGVTVSQFDVPLDE
jgi:predicted phosphodiesterase